MAKLSIIQILSFALLGIYSAPLYAHYCPDLDQVKAGTFECPKVPVDFRILRDRMVAVATHSDDVPDAELFRSLGDGVQSCYANDPEFRKMLNAKPEIGSCFKNLMSAAAFYHRSENVTDVRSDDANPDLQWPEELKNENFLDLLTHAASSAESNRLDGLSVDFERALKTNLSRNLEANPTKGTSLAQATQYIEREINSKKSDAEKWIVFPYRSSDLLTFDTVMVIDIPGEPEKIVQIERTKRGFKTAVISIHKTQSGKKTMIATDHSDVNAQFLNFENDGRQLLNTQRCQACHSMGLKAFVPVHLDPKYQKNYKRFMDHIEELAPLSFSGENHNPFPSLADKDSHREERRSPAFFSKCAPGLPPEAVQRVKTAMNCASCHYDKKEGGLGTLMNPGLFGAAYRSYMNLSVPNAQNMLDHGVSPIFGETGFSMILSGEMPPGGDHLKDTSERVALLRCLTTEYFSSSEGVPGILSNWLSEGSCGVTEQEEAIEMVGKLPAVTSDPARAGALGPR